MLQYLLNATSIWLVSLVLFDIFLRRESYHGYNRFYLLFTFLLGMSLPLCRLQDDSAVFYTSLKQPMEQLIAVKQNIVSTASLPSTKINVELYIEYAYALGAIVALLLLIIEVIKIVRFYQRGKKSREGSCVIVETGKNYSPFSLFNLVFVSSKDNYNKEEWDILIAHEQMHELLFHFADVLLMQLAKIVFWFHPLIYVYQKRLMMQHEYQADRVSTTRHKLYGQFLIEQALLQTAPSISHSFNRSPIKNRIVMLSRKSSLAAKGKMFVFIPLVLVCIVCFSKNSFSQKFAKNGNTVTYKGNRFEYCDPKVDTVSMTDPVSGKEEIRIVTLEPMPVKMNGKKLYNTDEVTSRPQPYAKNGSIEEYLLKNLSKELQSLQDGNYTPDLSNVVFDAKGKVIFYEYHGLGNKNTPPDLDKSIAKKIDELLNEAPAVQPAKIKDEPVAIRSDIMLTGFTIVVKDHKATYTRKW